MVFSKIEKEIILFIFGGMSYFMLEIIVRGYSHYTMFLCGGFCFLFCGELNEKVQHNISFVGQMVLSSVVITMVEFITGLIVNVWLHWDIWDYSNMPYNLLGQICLLYSTFWFFISGIIILMDDFLRHILFHEEIKHYKIF